VTQAIKACSVDGDCTASEQCSPDASCVTYTCDGVTGLQKTACDSEPLAGLARSNDRQPPPPTPPTRTTTHTTHPHHHPHQPPAPTNHTTTRM
jgi:hypothetical protein